MRWIFIFLCFTLGAPGARAQSLAERADAAERSVGFEPEDFGAWRPLNPASLDSAWLQRGVPASQQYRDPRSWIRPIRHRPPDPASHGPTRWLRTPYGGAVPDYVIPYGRRGNYRFAGIR